MFRLACPQLLGLLSAAEGVLAETGDAVALCPAYGLAADPGPKSGDAPAHYRRRHGGSGE